MRDTLIELLTALEYPVYLQGSLLPDQPYDPSFFTIWNSDSYDGSHYDNDAVSTVWRFSVMFYSVDPALVQTALAAARAALKAAGWIVSGRGYDVASDEPTHTGRGFDALYLDFYGRETNA